MDISLYSVMFANKQYATLHEVNTNNLANANTDGFKQDNVTFTSMYLNGGGAPSVASFSELGGANIDMRSGPLVQTGNQADVSVNGEGFFQLVDAEGNLYFRKSLSVMKNANGILVNSDGGQIIGQGGGPIQVGENPFMTDAKGNVMVRNGEANQLVDSLIVVELAANSAFKLPTGNISVDPANPPLAAQNYSVLQGYKEASNVNSVKAMATMLDLQKNYEFATKAMSSVRQIHKSSNSLLE